MSFLWLHLWFPLNFIRKQSKDGVQNYCLFSFLGVSLLFTNFVGADKSSDMREGNVFAHVRDSVHGEARKEEVSPHGDPTPLDRRCYPSFPLDRVTLPLPPPPRTS